MAAKAAAAEKVEFLYEGTNRGGTKVKGEIFALNDALAKNELRKQGINPLKVKKKPKSLFGGAAKITPSDIAIFAPDGDHDAGGGTAGAIFRNYRSGQ